MRVRQGLGGIVAAGLGEADRIPRGGIYYQVFGEGTNLVDFAPKLESIDDDTRRLLADIAQRLTLIDRLENLSRSFVDSQLDALPLYLLCTCIDALANPTWLPFNDWMATRKQKYEITERDAKLQALIGDIDQISDAVEFVTAVLDLYRTYLKHHGTSRKFGQFFLELPDEVKSFVADAYMVLDGDQIFIDPAVRQAWLDRSVDERLQAVAGYLYQYRRNDFTHGVKAHRTTGSDNLRTLEEALTKKPGEPRGASILFFYEDNDYEKKEVKLTVLVSESEVFLLRTAIVCYCRSLLGLENRAEFIRQHAERHHRLLILRNVVNEIQRNWRVYKYYSMDWMAYEDKNDRYCGIPEFQWDWLEAVLELDLEGYGLVTENLLRDVRTCIARLEVLNDPIRQLNEDFPPLYIRNQREDLRNVPEDEQAKQRAKIDLFQHLRRLREYSDARWYLGQLIRIFSEMLHIVPDQGGPRFYGYSAPDYRGWL